MEFDKPEIFALISALVGVVGVLWRIHLFNNRKEQERLRHCEEMHKESQKQVIELTANYHELKGRMDGVEKLSLAVLETIENNQK